MSLSLAPLEGVGAKLSESDLAKEAGHFTLPLVNYSSDSGFGYGLRAYWYDNGSDEGVFR